MARARGIGRRAPLEPGPARVCWRRSRSGCGCCAETPPVPAPLPGSPGTAVGLDIRGGLRQLVRAERRRTLRPRVLEREFPAARTTRLRRTPVVQPCGALVHTDLLAWGTRGVAGVACLVDHRAGRRHASARRAVRGPACGTHPCWVRCFDARTLSPGDSAAALLRPT